MTITKPLTQVSDSALSQALRKPPEDMFYNIFKKLRHRQEGRRVFALDGSKVRVPPSFARHGYEARTRDERSKHCLGMLSSLVDVDSREVLDYRWSSHFDERKHGLCVRQA